MSWRHSVVALVVVLGCGKDPREQARAIADDKSLATPVALEKIGALIYPQAKVWAEPQGDKWRVFVTMNVDQPATITTTGNETKIEYVQVIDGKVVDQDSGMMAVGHARGVTEVLVLRRYHATVDGRVLTIVQPRRTIAKDEFTLQSFDSWEPADLAKAQPYDLVMNDRKPVVWKRP